MYEKEVKKLLRDLFFEFWMTEDDWEEFLIELETKSNISIKKLSDDIEIGVNNGYSVKKQLELVKKVLKEKNIMK